MTWGSGYPKAESGSTSLLDAGNVFLRQPCALRAAGEMTPTEINWKKRCWCLVSLFLSGCALTVTNVINIYNICPPGVPLTSAAWFLSVLSTQ